MLKEIVRNHAGLWNAVDAAPNFKVDPAVAGVDKEVVFLGKFVRDVVKSYSKIFWAVEWGLQVEIAYIECGELGARAQEDAVEDELGKFK